MSPPMYTPPAKNGAMPMYGSGSAPWMGSNYDDCVNREFESGTIIIVFLTWIHQNVSLNMAPALLPMFPRRQ